MTYLFLTFIWPLVNFLQENFEKINGYSDLSFIFFILTFLSFTSNFLLRKLSNKPIDRWLLLVFSLVAFFFGYSPIVEAIGSHKIGGFAVKASYAYLLIIAGLSYIFWRIAESVNVQKISKILICVVFGFSIFNLALKFISHLNKKIDVEDFKKSGSDKKDFLFKHKPNVYYILVDAYARQDTLKEIMGYDNEPFLKELEKFGFIVSRTARSNYHFTGASLSATMNLLPHESDQSNLIQYDQMHNSLKGKNLVRKIFRENNYNIVNIPAHWHQMRCYGNENVCFLGRSYEVYTGFLSQTPLKIFHMPNSYLDFELVRNASRILPGKSKFIFAHFAQIHDAVFDESGKFISVMHPCFSGKKDGNRYIFSIKTMNIKIINFIQELRKTDPLSIIIIQADHGPTYVGNLMPKEPAYWLAHNESIRLNNKQDFRYTFGIFTAIYLPNYDDRRFAEAKKYFSGEFTLVNTFRYVFAYLSDMVPNLLPEKSHFLYYDQASQAYKEDNIDHITN